MKGVASLILMLSMILVTGCTKDIALLPPVDAGQDNPPDESPSSGYKVTKDIGSLRLILQTDQETYSLGIPIPLRFEVVNIGSVPIQLTFSTSRNFDLLVKSDGALIWGLSFGKHYLQVITELTLEPGQSRTFAASWAQVDNAGNPVPAGAYEIVALLPATTASEPLESAPLVIQIKAKGLEHLPAMPPLR
jgi:hypothetical protein